MSGYCSSKLRDTLPLITGDTLYPFRLMLKMYNLIAHQRPFKPKTAFALHGVGRNVLIFAVHRESMKRTCKKACACKDSVRNAKKLTQYDNVEGHSFKKKLASIFCSNQGCHIGVNGYQHRISWFNHANLHYIDELMMKLVVHQTMLISAPSHPTISFVSQGIEWVQKFHLQFVPTIISLHSSSDLAQILSCLSTDVLVTRSHVDSLDYWGGGVF